MALSLALADALTGRLSGLITTLVGITALIGGAGRYWAVLLGRPRIVIERATAIGFFAGIPAACIVFIVEVLV